MKMKITDLIMKLTDIRTVLGPDVEIRIERSTQSAVHLTMTAGHGLHLPISGTETKITDLLQVS